MNPAIEGWTGRIRTEMDRARVLLTDAPPADRLNVVPAPGEWSAAQHLDHLARVTDLAGAKIDAALGPNPPTGNPSDWQANWFERIFIAACGPNPPGGSTPVPPIFRPGDGPFDPDELCARFIQAHDRFLALLARADGVDVRRVKVPSAALPLLKIRLGAWFEAMTVHIAYHVDRARTLAG